MRLENGAFRPIGQKNPVYPKPPYSKIVVHRQGDFENWVGLDGVDLEYYNPVDTSVTQSLGSIEGEIYDIRTLKNFLVVTTSLGLRAWLWSDNVYNEINLTGLETRFDVAIGQDFNNFALPEWTDEVYLDGLSDQAAELLIGAYHKKVSEFASAGKFFGAVSYRIGLRLFDGTYIMHTPPRLQRLFHYDMLLDLGPSLRSSVINPRLRFGASGLTALAQFDVSDGFDYEGLSKLVSSIDLFVSPVTPFYEISENTITRDLFAGIIADAVNAGSNNGIVNARDKLPINPDFKELNDQPAWYKIGSIDMGNLKDAGGDMKNEYIELDMEGFYENYSTRRTLPVDGFSHHASTGEASYIYNNRLILGDTTQILGTPDVLGKGQINSRFGALNDLSPIIDGVTYIPEATSSTYRAKAVISLNTEAGARQIVSDISVWVYYKPGEFAEKAIFLNSMTGYFDSRATSIRILLSVDSGATFKELATKNLTPSKYGNYSVIPFDKFEATELTVPDYPSNWPKQADANYETWQLTFNANTILAAPAVTVPTTNSVVKNGNGRQVSNVNSPLFYDAANYQDVSIGRILAFGSNTDAISDSQFGQYPLYNFTTTGIWASQVGSGEVFLISDVPVNGEVILNKEAKVDLSLGTVYATLDGLKILSGREPVEISTNVEGQTEDYFIDNEQLQEFLNLPQTVDVANLVDKVPFTTYLLGAKIGFSKGLDDEEIYIANPNYDYVYMFDLDTKLWSKVKLKIESFINLYPELYAIGGTNVINVSREIEGLVPLYFHTKPLSFDNFEAFKKLRRSFLRGFIQTAQGKYAAFYLFSSDDLLNWRFETGNDYNSGAFNNIWCTHSWDSKRFYIYVFAVEVDYGPNKPTWINGIEIEYDVKWNSKLR